MTELRQMTLAIRTVDTDKREVAGIAVPYGTEIELYPGVRESVRKGAAKPAEDAKLFWRHRDPIGLITAARQTDEGLEITARISATPLGDEAYTLARDGVIDRFSIGFEPISHEETKREDGSLLIEHTDVCVREVSLVPFPAYPTAAVTSVREQPAPPTPKETTVDPETLTRADLTAIDQAVTDLGRRIDAEILPRLGDRQAAPALRYRTAADMLHALATERPGAAEEYNRVQALALALREGEPAGTTPAEAETAEPYPGGVLADMPGEKTWVGDLSKLVQPAGSLIEAFAQGVLPRTGQTLEYGTLTSDTTKVAEQAKEADPLPFGKIKLGVQHATVHTYGGWTSMSRQAIERASRPYLATTLQALGLATRRNKIAAFRQHFDAVVAAQTAARRTVTVTDPASWKAWVRAIVEAAQLYQDQGLTIDALIVDGGTFADLTDVVGADDRPMLAVAPGTGNTVGSYSPTGLSASLGGIPVRVNVGQAARQCAFINKAAIRSYWSPVAQLQDDNIVNLTRDFSLYHYGAIATEIPEAIVPVKLGGAA